MQCLVIINVQCSTTEYKLRGQSDFMEFMRVNNSFPIWLNIHKTSGTCALVCHIAMIMMMMTTYVALKRMTP